MSEPNTWEEQEIINTWQVKYGIALHRDAEVELKNKLTEGRIKRDEQIQTLKDEVERLEAENESRESAYVSALKLSEEYLSIMEKQQDQLRNSEEHADNLQFLVTKKSKQLIKAKEGLGRVKAIAITGKLSPEKDIDYIQGVIDTAEQTLKQMEVSDE